MSDSFHEVCLIFPPMTAEEFLDLKADIEANGLRDPITRHEGQVVDGRQRLMACRELGVKPDFVEWDGIGSLAAFVASKNLRRRHLTFGQRLAVGVAVHEQLAIEAKERQRANGRRKQGIPPGQIDPPQNSVPVQHSGRSSVLAGKIVGVGSRSLVVAKAIQAKAPDVFEKVKSGELTLSQGRRQVDRIERRRDMEVKATRAEAARVATGASRWEVIHGDSLDVLSGTKPGTARLVFADPPYNIGVDYGDGADADSLPDAEYLAWTALWIEASVRLLTPDGSLWVLIGDEYADHMGVLLRRAGLHRRAWIKWYETFGVNVPNGFNRTSRHLFHCVMDPNRCVFHREAVSRPSDRQAKYNDPRADPDGKTWDDVWGVKPAIPRLVGTASERLADFPTQLPESLLLAVVGCASDPGDLIVDPFSGSGTTGVASLKLGRRYLGSEKSSEYVRVSRLRLTAAEGGLL